MSDSDWRREIQFLAAAAGIAIGLKAAGAGPTVVAGVVAGLPIAACLVPAFAKRWPENSRRALQSIVIAVGCVTTHEAWDWGWWCFLAWVLAVCTAVHVAGLAATKVASHIAPRT
jgi:hypothetical protein